MKTRLILILAASVLLPPAVFAAQRQVGQLADGRLYLKDEFNFELKPNTARDLSPTGAKRQAVDRNRLRGLHGSIRDIIGGHTGAKRWLEGKELPARIQGSGDDVPRIARCLKAKLRAGQDAAVVVGELQNHPDLVWASLVFVQRVNEIPDDPLWSNQWGPPRIQAPDAWDVTPASMSIRIAIVDTGVDLAHPDLASRIVYDAGFGDNDSGAAPTDGKDAFDHGTHVAGIAAAIRNNGKYVAGLAEAQLMAMGCSNWSEDDNEYHITDVADAIRDALANGADVINCSFTQDSPLPADMKCVLDDAYALGVVVIVAAGNSAKDVDESGSAGWNEHSWPVIVSAIDSSDALVYYSNFGKAIDLAAPGDTILSTVPTYATPAPPPTVAPGSSILPTGPTLVRGTGYKSGTSMAAPHVAGAAAMVKSMNPDLITGWGVPHLLFRMAEDIGSSGDDTSFGKGLVQVDPSFLRPLKKATAFCNPEPWLENGSYIFPYNDIPTALAEVSSGATLVLNGGLSDVSEYCYPALTITKAVTLTALPDRPVTIGQ